MTTHRYVNKMHIGEQGRSRYHLETLELWIGCGSGLHTKPLFLCLAEMEAARSRVCLVVCPSRRYSRAERGWAVEGRQAVSRVSRLWHSRFGTFLRSQLKFSKLLVQSSRHCVTCAHQKKRFLISCFAICTNCFEKCT